MLEATSHSSFISIKVVEANNGGVLRFNERICVSIENVWNEMPVRNRHFDLVSGPRGGVLDGYLHSLVAGVVRDRAV